MIYICRLSTVPRHLPMLPMPTSLSLAICTTIYICSMYIYCCTAIEVAIDAWAPLCACPGGPDFYQFDRLTVTVVRRNQRFPEVAWINPRVLAPKKGQVRPRCAGQPSGLLVAGLEPPLAVRCWHPAALFQSNLEKWRNPSKYRFHRCCDMRRAFEVFNRWFF